MLDFVVFKLLAKANQSEQTKECMLYMLPDFDVLIFIKRRERLKADDDKVTAEAEPCGAIERQGDVVLITAEEFVCGHRPGLVSEGGSVRNQGFVSKGVTGNKD
ncbi:hypothetical protein V6N13_105816 [Hibiscus sabdariffa]|uniref:Uncharacterized protein n=1 Tax=Hibiscus sabdariffa TaxID=183260 RepID=A0ABR2EYT8_9ROSI